uniref:TBC1 domain family member 24 n=1 Tax=Panagrellus redivivus TaxID=6233 RepID=A0A7E4VEM7_PANRE
MTSKMFATRNSEDIISVISPPQSTSAFRSRPSLTSQRSNDSAISSGANSDSDETVNSIINDVVDFESERSTSFDSGCYSDEAFNSEEFATAQNLAKAWKMCAEFRRRVEDGKDTTSIEQSIQREIAYVKKFVRNNDWPVSHEIRSDIWRILCHTKDYDAQKTTYHQQLEDLTKSGVKQLQPLFLSFDGIVVCDHGLKEQGAVTLQRLLIVVECVRPEIRYVPILYPLCAMFLHYMEPEDTFACVMRLLSQGNGFMLQSEVAVYASAHTTLALLKKHKKKVYQALKTKVGTSDDEKLAEIFKDWSAWVFKYLPYAYLVRVLDCFLVEGHKMLLRVVLSLTYLWYKEKGKSTLPSSVAAGSVDEKLDAVREEIIQVVRDCPISISTLLDICTSIRNFKFSTVQRLQADFELKHRDKINLERSMKSQLSPTRTMYTQAFSSAIIDCEVASEIMNALPTRFQLETPSLLFRLSENGVSFTQLWNLIDQAEQSILIIKSTKNEVFGAYCSASWSERRDFHERTRSKYFGTGESFVWYADRSIGLPRIFHWAGTSSDHPDDCPQMFMTANDRLLIVGSGGGDAISIRDELTSGLSYACNTFSSPALVPGNAFEIAELEVFSVVSSVD